MQICIKVCKALFTLCIQALLLKIVKARDSVAGLEAKKLQLVTHMDAVNAANVECDFTMLRDKADDLIQDADTLRQQIESDLDAESKLNTKLQLLLDFLDDANVVGDWKKSVDGNQLRQLHADVADKLKKFTEMEPVLGELNDAEIIIYPDEKTVIRLRDLNHRWTDTRGSLRDKDAALKRRIQRLQTFSEKCKAWTEFVATVETDLANDNLPSYSALAEEQLKWQVTN